MPLTVASGRVEASPKDGGKAMANAAEMTDWRRGPVLGPSASCRGQTGPVLTRNEVLRETLGGRTWLGAVTNRGERACTGLQVRIRFLDRTGTAVGAPVSARTDWLEPGAALHLQARLPPEAAGLEIVSLRWTAAGRTVELAPAGPRPLGAEPA